jgi:hypothetical protein
MTPDEAGAGEIVVTEQFADAISKRIVVAHRRGLSSSQLAHLFFFRIMMHARHPAESVAIANAATMRVKDDFVQLPPRSSATATHPQRRRENRKKRDSNL